ncbi:TonB-dependent receptor [Hephaestia mangrovi]|uniref:TonB-dependent receptor n=1 Tax=Hephaestia mangrovi TaxID=2873268 RepID=UPI001CA75AE7|nr:TonB-dependent receptor [Hephaestia mangrovi]MBY8826645.1 TonB-dependent receptor [Hephaestia mangrovi]
MTARKFATRHLRFAAALMVGSAACALVTTPLQAQQSTAALRGVITDNGQPAGTQVTAVNVDTGYRSVSPINNGAYNFAALLPGRYRLDVTTATGQRQTDVFTLTVGQNAQLSFDLSQGAPAAAGTAEPNPNAPAETAENAPPGGDIIVTGNRIKSLDAGSVGVTISQHQIEALPQNNRNFLAFADLAPGVQFISDAAGNTSLRGGAQQANAVNVFIDGVSQKDDILKGGITGQDSTQGNPFPQLGIAEYKVISQNYKAEFDQVSSAAITAVTKSGTNTFHGEAFFDFSNQSLRAKTPQEKHDGVPKVKTRDEQFGAALGGPIIKDMLHFFVTYEGKRIQSPVTITPPSGVSLDTIPDPYRNAFGEFNKTFNEDLYFGKLDFEPTDADLFEVSGKVRRETGLAANNGQEAVSTATALRNNETRILFHYQHTANAWVNDLKVEWQKSSDKPSPNVNATQYQFFTGAAVGDRPLKTRILSYGGGTNYQNKGQRGWTAQDDFTYTGLQGSTIKLGVKAQWLQLRTIAQTPYNPIYYFDADYGSSGFNDTLPYQLSFGVPAEGGSGGYVKSNDFQLGLYIQDDWDLTDRFTANIGIRWDYERDPDYLNYVTPDDVVSTLRNWSNLDNANYNLDDYISTGHNRHARTGEFQPRIGFTWDITPNGRFQLFGGYGRSYNRNQFDFISLENLQGSYKSVQYQFDTGDPQHPCEAGGSCIAWDPAYLTQEGRDMLATSTSGGNREIDLLNNNLKVPFSDQFSIGVRGRFGRFHAEVGYTHVVSQDGFVWLLGNRRPDGTFFIPGSDNKSSASQPWQYQPPGFNNNLLLGTNGMTTKLDQPYIKLDKDYTKASPWSLAVTYTMSLAEENRQSGNQYALDYPSIYAYPLLRALGTPKHRLVATGSTDLPLGFMLSGKFLLQSPTYVYGTTLADVPDPQNYPSVPMTTQGKGPWVKQLDLALTKYVGLGFLHEGSQIRLRADVFNVFNTHNYVGYISNPGSPDFGQRDPNNYDIGGYPPRTFKFTVGVSF